MPGTPRKSAAKKAAPRKAPPPVTPKVEPPVEDNAFDLLDALGTVEQSPVPVKLLGVHATVRRTFSAEEDLKFTEFLRVQRVKEALAILVGADAEPLSAKIDELSIEQGVKVINRLAQISTLVEGEALALLPTSAQRMVGALATPSSGGSTS